MRAPDDRIVLRLLAGELPPDEAERLRSRLAADPALARELRRLESAWEGVADAPEPGVVDLWPRIRDRLERASPSPGGLGGPPGWVRASAAATTLLLGVSLGVAAGLAASRTEAVADDLLAPSLAQSYWESFVRAEEEGVEELRR